MIEFYAEIGSNHNQSLDRALLLVDAAANAGCTGVKFQYFKADKMYDKKIYPDYWQQAKDRELPVEWLPKLSAAARTRGLEFGVSVFDLESVGAVAPYTDYLKLASHEACFIPLLEAVCIVDQPVMISMGLSTRQELMSAFGEMNFVPKNPIHILQCVSKYPAKPKDCNLTTIDLFNMRKGFGEGKLGWSDHTVSKSVIWMAIVQGAEIIECHIDLSDMRGAEYNYGHCWTNMELSYMIADVRIGERAIGTENWQEIEKQQDRTLRANPETGVRG